MQASGHSTQRFTLCVRSGTDAGRGTAGIKPSARIKFLFWALPLAIYTSPFALMRILDLLIK